MSCRKPGYNRLTYCIEEEGHKGCHTYSPDPIVGKEVLSEELEWVKKLLIETCPDFVVGDLVTPRPKHCPFHHGAAVLHEVQKKLKEMHE